MKQVLRGAGLSLVLVLAACPPDEEPECELVQLPACPTCGPGELRGGVNMPRDAMFDRLPGDRLVALSCGNVLYLDPSYRIERQVFVNAPWPSALVAAGSGDETYLLERHPPVYPEGDDFPDDKPTEQALVALDGAGKPRWRVDFGALFHHVDVMALPGGAFVFAGAQQESWPSRMFDRDGNEQPVPAMIGEPDASGGMIAVRSAFSIDLGTVEATITAIDASGTERWTRTWRTTNQTPQSTTNIYFTSVDPGPSGDIVITGSFSGATLDLGDTTVAYKPGGHFVARLAATGATRWVYVLDPLDPYYNLQHLKAVLTADDRVILGGIYVGNGAAFGLPVSAGFDAFIATVTGDGLTAARYLGGPADQFLERLDALSDGSVAVTIAARDDYEIISELEVGTTTLVGGDRDYVLNIAP